MSWLRNYPKLAKKMVNNAYFAYKRLPKSTIKDKILHNCSVLFVSINGIFTMIMM